MQRLKSQRGAALVLVIGITAALAVLAATAVLVTVNTQHATADTRAHATALDYAEAALNSGVLTVTTQPWPATGGSFSDSELKAAYVTTYPSGPGANVVTYDNQNPVNKSIKVDPSTGGDGTVWVEAWVTYNGQTARVREMVGQKNSTVPFSYPKAAIYSDSNVIFDKGVGNVWAINADGSLDISKTIGVYAGGNVTGNNSSSTFNPVGGGPATVSVNYNGTYTNLPVINPTLIHGGVPALNTVVTPANVTTMTTLAKSGDPTQAKSTGTVVAATTISGNTSYGGVNGASAGDVVVNGNLVMSAGTRYFKSLYVNGSLTQNGGGTFNATALYVRDTLTIGNNASGKWQIGPTWVGRDFVILSGGTIQTTDWTGAAPYGTTPGPLYVGGNLNEGSGGAYNFSWGNTYVGGNVTFEGNSGTVLCPLMVTSGVVNTAGGGSAVVFGTVDQPMVLLGLAGSTAGTMTFTANATFTGVIINMGGGVTLKNNGNPQPPNNYNFFVDGAVMATGTVEFANNANVGYNPTVVANATDNFPAQIGTTTTSVLSGTWQQLSPNGQ